MMLLNGSSFGTHKKVPPRERRKLCMCSSELSTESESSKPKRRGGHLEGEEAVKTDKETR